MSNSNTNSNHFTNSQQSPKHSPMERVIPRPQPLHNPSLSRHHRAIDRPSMSLGNDQAFIEFSRCLYQAKTIVKELQAFSASVSPSLRMSMLRQNNLTDGQDNQKETAEQFLNSIRHYLETTFEKFARLCKVLMFVLSKMEASGNVRIERITSFRRDVTEAWRVANDIKDRLNALIAQESMFLNYGDTATPASMASAAYNGPRSAPSPCESQNTDKMPAYSQASPSIASSPASSPYNFF
ncbi:hypothetical protein INT43_000863 [Umbelopsis isabellina]|uniref:Uncharacterized protein n=1 Tax=Mortierella isabellina TaxID=91625 RepID=A0A8H7Q435_MORIS|nr:hypothetical protein INT43_000863 [Umbelopsis isabellina]